MPKYFGDVDRDVKGKIGSSYPAWYFETQREELQESVAAKRRALEGGGVSPENLPFKMQELKQEEAKLREILDAKPTLKGVELDEVVETRKEFGEGISETLFTRDEMASGKASPHEEVRRMTERVIKVSSDGMARACQDCGVTILDGHITRNEAAKVWKIMSKLLGEPSNVEDLRK